MKPMTKTEWPEVRIEKLVSLFTAGESYEGMAKKLKSTKQAITSKLGRLRNKGYDLPPRLSVKGKKLKIKTPAVVIDSSQVIISVDPISLFDQLSVPKKVVATKFILGLLTDSPNLQQEPGSEVLRKDVKTYKIY